MSRQWQLGKPIGDGITLDLGRQRQTATRVYLLSPLIRPPLASPRGIILTHNIQPSLTWRGPFAQRLAGGWAVRNFFCMGRVAPVQQGLKSREFRVAAGRLRYHAALSAYRTTPVVQGRDSP